MSGDTSANFDALSLIDSELVDQACDRFERAWRSGEWPCIEAYLDSVQEPSRAILLVELVKLELELRRGLGERPSAAEYAIRFPDQRSAIDLIFRRDRSDAARSTLLDRAQAPADDLPTVDMSTLREDPERCQDPPPTDGDLGRQLGDYLLLDQIGHGGMGVVYRALQRGTRRIVALKIIKADWRGDSTSVSTNQAQKRFHDEAKVHAALDHEHIVPLYDAGHEAGLLYFSMRLIKGRSLARMLLGDGPLPPRKAAYYVEAIARAVQYAHDHNILHRDLKPANIMVDENDRPYLIDLGLARSLEATDFTSLSGKVLGTAEYMAPEQAQGRSDVDKIADVYGLGATLFALLTGRPPFTGDDPIVVLRKVIDEEPAWPRSSDRAVGRELKAICLKCLDKNRASRFPSAGAFAKTLRDYLEYRPTGIAPPSPWARLEKWVRRKPWRAAATGLGTAAVVILAASLVWNSSRSRAQAESLAHDLLTLPVLQLPDKLAQAARQRSWIDPLLRAANNKPSGDTDREFRIALALVGSEPERAPEIARLVLEAGPDELHVAAASLKAHWSKVSPIFFAVLDESSVPSERRARAAAALIALDGPRTPAGRAYAELKAAPDPERRITLLEWLVKARIDPRILADRLAVETDVSIQRMLIQALADQGAGAPPAGLSQEDVGRFVALYRDHPDPGVHSSLARLLRRFGAGVGVDQVDQSLKGQPSAGRRWLVTSWGETMALVGGGGDPVPSSSPTARRLARFAITVAETTLADYRAFDPNHAARRKEENAINEWRADLPADFVSYNDAAAYCNWRTLNEGLPRSECCYSSVLVGKQLALVANYTTRRGYRLPDLEEWETAARAGTVTDRYFGKKTADYADYAWASRNSNYHTESTALLRPNDYGLFDVLGNLLEWCSNPNPPHDLACRCKAPNGGLCEKIRFVSYRGGCFCWSNGYLTTHLEIDALDRIEAFEAYAFTGFRIVKATP